MDLVGFKGTMVWLIPVRYLNEVAASERRSGTAHEEHPAQKLIPHVCLLHHLHDGCEQISQWSSSENRTNRGNLQRAEPEGC